MKIAQRKEINYRAQSGLQLLTEHEQRRRSLPLGFCRSFYPRLLGCDSLPQPWTQGDGDQIHASQGGVSAAWGLGARKGRGKGRSPLPAAPRVRAGRGCSTPNPTRTGCFFARTRSRKHVLHQFKPGRKSCLAPGASRAADSSVSGACLFCCYRQSLTGHRPRGKALPRQEVASASEESPDGKQPPSPGLLRTCLCCARTGGGAPSLGGRGLCRSIQRAGGGFGTGWV